MLYPYPHNLSIHTFNAKFTVLATTQDFNIAVVCITRNIGATGKGQEINKERFSVLLCKQQEINILICRNSVIAEFI